MSRWRDISTYRPGVDPDEALVLADSLISTAMFMGGLWWDKDVDVSPTHWQPLPPLPGEEVGVLEWEDKEMEGFAKCKTCNYGPFMAEAFENGALRFWKFGSCHYYPTRDQAASMELAQAIADAIRAAQGEKEFPPYKRLYHPGDIPKEEA